MNDKRQIEQPQEGLSLGDIYFVLFRQKWKIVFCSAVGLAIACALYLARPAQYQSEAKLLIRYVMENKAPNPGDKEPVMKVSNSDVINTEIEILTSLDLAQEVVKAIGVDRILGKAGLTNAENQAAVLVTKSLIIEPPTKDSVIPVIYQHPDQATAKDVLNEVILAYLKKHDEMHRPVGMTSEALTQQTKRLGMELDETERQLREAKRKAGVVSVAEAKKDLAEQISKVREDLFAAEADLAEHQAALQDSGRMTVGHSGSTNGAAANAVEEIPPQKIQEYRMACTRLEMLLQKEEQGLDKYAPESPFLKEIRDQVSDAEKRKQRLEEEYPKLAAMLFPAPQAARQSEAAAPTFDFAHEAIRARQLQAKTNQLHSELDQILREESSLEEMEGAILNLERRKETLEANLRSFLSSLEQTRIDAELGRGSGDIGIVQYPSVAEKKRPKSFKKLLMMIAAGGVGAGFGLAFLIEMFLDHSVKRAAEVEKKLRLPLFISIPKMNGNGHPQIAGPAGKDRLRLAGGESDSLAIAVSTPSEDDGTGEVPPWDRRHSLHRYYAGLRDRLIVNFEVRNLTHHPKLVAVSSCHRGAGVSTIAAGLAASLSETGDGNVLLVDMNLEQGAAQQFYKGRPFCGLEDALENETMNNALVQENLYVASEQFDGNKLPRVLPRRFASLMPKLKASDYDYIIFDLPPISQTSMTPRLAGLMDMVLLVLEAEKTNQEIVKKAVALLAESKANVSTVLNKTQTYVPPQLHQDTLSDI